LTTTAQPFDANIANWKEYQDAPWGRLRYSIAHANLNRHLPQRPLNILDAGGGNGFDAIACATQGHMVTLVDFSTEMLTEARRTAEAHGVAERMTVHQADVAAIPTLFPEPVFDVALCHNIVQYVDDATELLRAVGHPLKRDGLLSLMSINPESETYRQALMQLDPAAALASLDATMGFAVAFGVPVHRRNAANMIELLESASYTVLKRYGIRCVTDYMPNNDIKSDPAFFARLEQLEYALSDRHPYSLLARFFQIVARKADFED